MFRHWRLRRAERRAKKLRAEYAEFQRYLRPTFESGGKVGGASVQEAMFLQGRIASNDELIRQLGGTPEQ